MAWLGEFLLVRRAGKASCWWEAEPEQARERTASGRDVPIRVEDGKTESEKENEKERKKDRDDSSVERLCTGTGGNPEPYALWYYEQSVRLPACDFV